MDWNTHYEDYRGCTIRSTPFGVYVITNENGTTIGEMKTLKESRKLVRLYKEAINAKIREMPVLHVSQPQ